MGIFRTNIPASKGQRLSADLHLSFSTQTHKHLMAFVNSKATCTRKSVHDPQSVRVAQEGWPYTDELAKDNAILEVPS